jgi:hypothetical protein
MRGNDDARICLTDAVGNSVLSCIETTDYVRQCDRRICLTPQATSSSPLQIQQIMVGNPPIYADRTDHCRHSYSICLTDAVGNSIHPCTDNTSC